MPAIYDHQGFTFAYPENWVLEADPDSFGEVLLNTPKGGFWTLQPMPEGVSPGECVDRVRRAMREEYDEIEEKESSLDLESHHLVGCELRFFCLDFLVEARVWSCRVPGRTLLFHYQAEQREFESTEPVFLAVTASVFRANLGSSDTPH